MLLQVSEIWECWLLQYNLVSLTDTEEADRDWENAKHKYIKTESEELKMKKKIDQIRYGERKGAKETIKEKRKNRERWEKSEREKWQKKKKVIKAVVAQVSGLITCHKSKYMGLDTNCVFSFIS